eukprot:1007857-Pleurochrysis_carterae.AAC.1
MVNVEFAGCRLCWFGCKCELRKSRKATSTSGICICLYKLHNLVLRALVYSRVQRARERVFAPGLASACAPACAPAFVRARARARA